MKNKELLIALIAIVIGVALGWLIATQPAVNTEVDEDLITGAVLQSAKQTTNTNSSDFNIDSFFDVFYFTEGGDFQVDSFFDIYTFSSRDFQIDSFFDVYCEPFPGTTTPSRTIQTEMVSLSLVAEDNLSDDELSQFCSNRDNFVVDSFFDVFTFVEPSSFNVDSFFDVWTTRSGYNVDSFFDVYTRSPLFGDPDFDTLYLKSVDPATPSYTIDSFFDVYCEITFDPDGTSRPSRSFPTEMVSLDLAYVVDEDFTDDDLTTLCKSGKYSIDSFFDVFDISGDPDFAVDSFFDVFTASPIFGDPDFAIDSFFDVCADDKNIKRMIKSSPKVTPKK